MPSSPRSTTTRRTRNRPDRRCSEEHGNQEPTIIWGLLCQLEASMAVNEPLDVLESVQNLAASYVGQRPWPIVPGSVASNPVKLRSQYPATAVLAHTEPRNHLSAREGAALLYALQSQHIELRVGSSFARSFRHDDGRELVLENGVVEDLLGVGVISHRERPDDLDGRFVVTGLGAREIRRCFPAWAL